MRKIILVSAIALLAACGGSDKKAASGDTTGATTPASAGEVTSDSTSDSVEASDDTIVVDDFGDMPPKCIELLGTFLKQIEPEASKIDWDTATFAEFETFSAQFEKESDAFDTQSSAAGCDKYDLSGTDAKQFEQMSELAAAEAPGTVGFVEFLATLSNAQTATAGSLPEDCAGTIAAIEPFLSKGTIRDLTVSEVGVVGQLMGSIRTKCTPEEADAFLGRDDVSAFMGQ